MNDSYDVKLTEADGAVLIATAREAIACRLENRSPRWPVAGMSLTVERGAFVTLRTGKGEDAPLRGCIGLMRAKDSLVRTVRAMAAAAAFEDPRFTALVRSEYPNISIEITVLGSMKQALSVSEIEVGRHGVYLSKGWHSAIFLPQVAVEQGWNRDELLSNLCYKAGLPAEAWKDEDAKFQIFEGKIIKES